MWINLGGLCLKGGLMQALLISSFPDETAVFQVILQQAGFMVRAVRDLEQAIEDWPDNPSDLVLIALTNIALDTSLKHVAQMRAHTVVPMILIVDPISDDLQVSLLEEGADLVVHRPYSVRFLLAQIRALLRRSTGVPFFSLPILTQQDLLLDPADRSVQVGEGERKKLTHLEFRLLYTLMTHVGQIIPAEQIVENVWGYSGEGNRDLVRGLVQRLRSKVESDPGQPRYILTEPGIGYYFNC
jgi:DNA-binding response OmpR family regulator